MEDWEDILDYLREKLRESGSVWRKTRDREKVKDCLVIIEAMNTIEERAYGRKQTTITDISQCDSEGNANESKEGREGEKNVETIQS